jgi:hypothetical protein
VHRLFICLQLFISPFRAIRIDETSVQNHANSAEGDHLPTRHFRVTGRCLSKRQADSTPQRASYTLAAAALQTRCSLSRNCMTVHTSAPPPRLSGDAVEKRDRL